MIVLDSKSTTGRLMLITAILAAILFGWFSVRWQLGNMLASLAQPTQQNAGEIAELARSFAPSDALPMWLIATREKETFSPESLEKSVGMFEQVVRLSPHDFRYWIELGRRLRASRTTRQSGDGARPCR